MQSGIVINHELEFQFVAPLFNKRRTNQSPSMFTHKINDGGVSGSSNKIAFIF
jgi:hypothetical protein